MKSLYVSSDPNMRLVQLFDGDRMWYGIRDAYGLRWYQRSEAGNLILQTREPEDPELRRGVYLEGVTFNNDGVEWHFLNKVVSVDHDRGSELFTVSSLIRDLVGTMSIDWRTLQKMARITGILSESEISFLSNFP